MDMKVRMDTDLRKQLTSDINEGDLKSAFEGRYGRGWQRKLGAVLDVPETTVNGWFKSGRFPALAKLAFGVLLSQPVSSQRKWIPVSAGSNYSVCDTEETIGRIVASNIPRLADAMLIAAAPMLREACDAAWPFVQIHYYDDNQPKFQLEGWDKLADQIEDALDVAGSGSAKTGADRAMEQIDQLSNEEAVSVLTKARQRKLTQEALNELTVEESEFALAKVRQQRLTKEDKGA